jgi:threonine dehydrogenase-like Zn-dependent dehydrogenase
MRATVLHAPFDVRLDTVADPQILAASDAVVRVSATCVCGSDLWPYRGIDPVTAPRRIGHEMVGIVESVGAEVSTIRPGQFVIAPFAWSDNTCRVCRHGITTSCENGGWWGAPDRQGRFVDACQGEAVRVPLADGTLVAAPDPGADRAATATLLTLSDVMSTGWHAARSARVSPADTVAVVGDGAVGLCAVLAAATMGAGRIIAMSRHTERQEVAQRFGATDVVAERGDAGVAAVKDLTAGLGVDAALECVGTAESLRTAIDVVRPGGRVGMVGVPHGVDLPIGQLFGRNLSLAGGPAPVRQYLPELLDLVAAGRIDSGAVFDLTLPLDQVAEAYAAMDGRRAIKAMLVP